MSKQDHAPLAPVSKEDARGYLFDMLVQLADIARGCGEARIAIVLSTIASVSDDRHTVTDAEAVLRPGG